MSTSETPTPAAVPPAAQSAAAEVQLCLISHTNIGKTTLTRTLLGEDVGDIRDAAHVTDSADAHVLLQTPQGDRLTLWDTPGFGDSVRLYQRLHNQRNPMGWFLSNIWDRWRDKPFWMAQRAMRAARDNADVVLYLVNAAEDPADAGYLDAEMHLLGWLGKPVIVLLNQLGTPGSSTQENADIALWSAALAGYAPMLRNVVALDAFTRTWLHEQRLFQVVQQALLPAKRAGYQRLIQQWEQENRERFDASMAAVAALLADAARWKEPVSDPGSAWRPGLAARALLPGRKSSKATPEEAAMKALLLQLQKKDQQLVETLLELHRLDGRAAAQVHALLNDYFTVQQPLNTRQMGLLGAVTTGCAGGLGADLATGGLSMGAGAMLGALAGAATFAGAALGINKVRAQNRHQVELSNAFLDDLLHASLLKYLAIAHFGRGRGHYVQTDAPEHWNHFLQSSMQPFIQSLHAIWEELRGAGAEPGQAGPAPSPDTRAGANTDADRDGNAINAQLARCLGEITLNTLQALYPAPADASEQPARTESPADETPPYQYGPHPSAP